MAKTKPYKSIHAFLEQSGVLESDDPALIKNARDTYWRSYHRDYKREQRQAVHEHTVTLTKTENALLLKEASRHDMTVAMMIKQGAIAYLQKQYIVLPNETLSVIQQQLSHILTLLENYGEQNQIQHSTEASLESIANMLRQYQSVPACLEDELRNALKVKPHYLQTLKTIIAEYDNKE